MSKTFGRALFWAPRILAILFAMFLGVFALDVFGEGLGLWRTVGALLLHLVPALLVLGALIVAWRRERAGAVLFVGLALLYVVVTRASFPLATYVVIAGPLLITSLLFFMGGKAATAE